MKIDKTPPLVIPYMNTIAGLFPHTMQRVAGEYYGILGAGIGSSAVAVVADKIYSAPFLVLKEESFDRIGISVGTGAVGAARLGIYASGTNWKPGSLVLDAGEIADTSSTGDKEITINQTLAPGLYWLVAAFNGTPSIISTTPVINLLGLPSTLATGGTSVISYAGMIYGALPATHPAFAATGRAMPAICMRRS